MSIDSDIFGSELDLHFFGPRETNDLLMRFLAAAKGKGLQRVRIINGKGKTKKKFNVYKILETHPDVQSFGNDGANWGATVVLLKS